MEQWRQVWRTGIAPQLAVEHLECLMTALVEDSPRMCQGYTTKPETLQCYADFPVDQACPLGICGMGVGLVTVEEVEEFFARIALKCDELIGVVGSVRWFTNWADDNPREEVRRELLIEVQRTLAERLSAEDVAANTTLTR